MQGSSEKLSHQWMVSFEIGRLHVACEMCLSFRALYWLVIMHGSQGLKWGRVARVGALAPFDLPGLYRVSCLLSCSSKSHKNTHNAPKLTIFRQKKFCGGGSRPRIAGETLLLFGPLWALMAADLKLCTCSKSCCCSPSSFYLYLCTCSKSCCNSFSSFYLYLCTCSKSCCSSPSSFYLYLCTCSKSCCSRCRPTWLHDLSVSTHC